MKPETVTFFTAVWECYRQSVNRDPNHGPGNVHSTLAMSNGHPSRSLILEPIPATMSPIASIWGPERAGDLPLYGQSSTEGNSRGVNELFKVMTRCMTTSDAVEYRERTSTHTAKHWQLIGNFGPRLFGLPVRAWKSAELEY